MPHDHRCRLTTKDFNILQAMLEERRERDDPLVPLLREKLATATVLPPQAVPADVVTLYSRVRYSIGGSPATTRIVIHDDAHGVVGATLPITTPRGLALLGLAKHARVTLRGRDGLAETIHVEDIVYQPQASLWLPSTADNAGGADGEARPSVRRPASAAAAAPAPRG